MKINQNLESLKAATSPSKPLTGGVASDKPETAGQKAPQAAGPDSAPVASPESSLRLSPLSSKLQQIETRLASGEAYDAARVSEIKQAIRDGSFKVDSEAVADKLLAGARDLFIQRH